MAKNDARNFTILRGGLYATPRTPEERLNQAVRSRYAALKNRRGVTPAPTIQQAAQGITKPLSTLARHIRVAKANRTEYAEMVAFADGLHADVRALIDEQYGRTQGPERGSAA